MSRPNPENSERDFLFMPTIYQRSKILQANLDKRQLSLVGEIVSAAFLDPSSGFGIDSIPTRKKIEGPCFSVWDYSDDFILVIDKAINDIRKEKTKRKRITSVKVKIT